MNIEEAYNTIKKSVEAINTRPYATKAEYEKVECIKVLLTAYEKEKETSHYIQSQLDIANAKLVEEKEKNKDLKEGYKIQEHNYQVAMEEIEQRWVDKIKAKVIEIKDRLVKDEFITATQGKLNTIIDIENLLDEEE